MKHVLGLDLGTNSIGWCLIEESKKIISSGVRVFPIGVNEEDFDKGGKEISKNVARRVARGARRRRSRFKVRQQKLIALLAENNMLPDDLISTHELYDLRLIGLDKKLSLKDFGRILMMLNKRRGFKSNKKTLSTEEAKKEEGVVKEGISQLKNEIEKNNCRTVGEYFATLFKDNKKEKNWHNIDNPLIRIRDRWVGREMYQHEFNLLWEKQKSYYQNILTDKLKTVIGDEIIYYQRNLKSQKGLVGKCRFEPNKRCAPKSSQLFQEFRVWQTLSVFRFANGERIGEPLTLEEKIIVFNYLNLNKNITKTELKKLLNISKSVGFNDVFVKDRIGGNTTNSRLISAIGEEMFNGLNEKHIFELWHLLSYGNNAEKMKLVVLNKIKSGLLPKLNNEQIEKLIEINLEDGYCNFSSKALNKILPHLRTGVEPFEAFKLAGYDPTKKLNKLGKIVELDKIKHLEPNELRNPIVQQILSETIRLVNSIVKKFGKPDMVRIELARELKKPKTIREEIRNNATTKRKRREEYAEFLSHKLKREVRTKDSEIKKYELWLELGCEDESFDKLEIFLKSDKVKDLTKFHLWKECNRISPYSGKVISLTNLFSPEIQIEHIWPFSKTMNNEFGNLSLCEASINKDKGNMLPLEYFSSKGKIELQKFKDRVSIFNGGKKYRFLATEIPPDFLNSQINNTSYAAKEFVFRVETILPPIEVDGVMKQRVQVSNGQATSWLRRLWGINAILSYGDIDTKNRADHRHHAIDALIIACTTPSILKTFSTYSKFNIENKLVNSKISEVLPWVKFRNDAENSINSFIVSYRNTKRAISIKLNKPRQKNLSKYPAEHSVQKSISIRGPLHEETLYGKIKLNGDNVFVTRWGLNKFTTEAQLEKVVDAKVREVLCARLKKYGGVVKSAFADNIDDPVLMYSTTGKKIPIRRVRVVNNSENLIEVRNKTFVESGNNFAIAIYQNAEGTKRKSETLTFWDATKKTIAHEQLFAKSFVDEKTSDTFNLLFILKQKDIVVQYKKHPDEIDWDNISNLRKNLYRVRKFDISGQIFLDYLYAAKIDEKKDRNKLYFQKSANTLNCVKITVNEIGEIVKKEG